MLDRLAPPTAAGIDGCRAGWLCVTETGDSLRAFVAPDIAQLVQQLPTDALIGIDIDRTAASRVAPGLETLNSSVSIRSDSYVELPTLRGQLL